MAMRLTTIQVVALLVAGVLASWLWVVLYGLWVVYDSPLLQWGINAGLPVTVVGSISVLLFAVLSGALFAALVKTAFRDKLVVAAAVFAAGFLGSFLVSAAIADTGFTVLASLGAFWSFLVFFGLAVVALAPHGHA